MTLVYIGVGSNIEPEKNVVEAVQRLGRLIRLAAASTFYRTSPVGGPLGGRKQGPFRNGVLLAFVDAAKMGPKTLKYGVLREVERALGRARSEDKYAPREMDLDVLLYGRLVLDKPDLVIPDPDIRTRPFLAVPLLELDPDLVLPDTGERLDGLEVVLNRQDLVPDERLTREVRQRL